VEKFIWAPTGKHFAYTIGTARAEWDALGVDDILNKKNSFMLDGKEIGLILEEPSPVHFIPQFRNLKWSYDGNKLYFKTNDKGNKGEIEWVINVDGTGLKRIIEDETANWKTYRNEKYGFEFKYPKEFAEDERCRAIEMENVIGIGMRIFITIKDSGGLSLSEYVDKEITFDIESRKNITVGSREAISIEYRFGGLGRYGKVVYLLKDDKIFNFSFTAGGECPSTDISELVVFDGILSTFRFLE